MTTWDHAFADRARHPSGVFWTITVAVAVFLIWASLASVDEIVRAPGQVVPASRPQIIQNLEGGILAEMSVHEGDIVEPGQVLARLQGTQYQPMVDDLSDQIAALEIRRLRLEAEMIGQNGFAAPEVRAARVPDIVLSEKTLLSARLTEARARIDGASAVLEQAMAERDLMERMLDQDVAPLVEVTHARKAFFDAEAQLAAAQTRSDLERATEFAKVQSDLVSLRQRLKISQDQLARTVLLAPMRGVVNAVAITTIGGVVRPGEEILQIIPLDEDLYIAARVAPRDIAAVMTGQAATVMLSAYDHTIWGTLPATVSFVSADTFLDARSRAADGDPHYQVTLRVGLTRLTDRQKGMEIRPGMQATVELKTGSRSVLTYLLKPLYKSSEALGER